MNLEEVLTISHDGRISIDGGIKGTYSSLHNLIREFVIYKSIYVENTKKSHVFCDPVYKIIKDKSKIMSKLKKIDIKALELMNQKCEENTNYYEIIFTNGRKIQILSEKLDESIKVILDSIIEDNEYIGDTNEKYIDYPPILDYTKNNVNLKLEILEQISQFAVNKKGKSFFKLLSSDSSCVIDYKNLKLNGKKEISKYIKKITGILNFKIPYFVSSDICGYINKNNESDLLLEISYYDKTESKRKKRYVTFELKNDIITKLNIYLPDELVCKKFNDVAISYVKNMKYDDLNDDIINDIKSNNKTYIELLNIAFPSRGTTTNMRNIRR